MIIKKITTHQEFKVLKNLWQHLFESAGLNSPFLSWEWMFTWWQIYRPRLTAAELSIFCIYEDDVLAAILPFFFHKKKNLIYIQFLGTEFESSDYLDIITFEEKKTKYFQAFFNEPLVLNTLRSADILVLNNIKQEAVLYRKRNRLSQKLNSRVFERRTSVCPYITLPESLDGLFKSLSKNMRSGLKRQRNKLNRNENIRIEVINDERKIQETIRHLFRLHEMRFSQKAMSTKFVYDRRGTFHETIARVFLKKNLLQFYLVKDNDKPIGALYCYRLNGTMMYMQGGFDPEYAKLALGNQIILRAVSDAIEAQMHTFDFMRGNEAYKKKWTDKSIFLYTLQLPLSFQGTILLQFQKSLSLLKKKIKNILFPQSKPQ